MSAFLSEPIFAGLLTLLTLLSGVWLSRSGKPFNTAIFTLHKLLALAAVIVITVNVRQLHGAVDQRTFVELAVIAVTAVLFLALLVTGALLSLRIPLSSAILKTHQVVPLLALVFSMMTLYLLGSGMWFSQIGG